MARDQDTSKFSDNNFYDFLLFLCFEDKLRGKKMENLAYKNVCIHDFF